MDELLQPRTDAGVAFQFAVAAIGIVTGLWWSRRRPDARLVVIGLSLLLVGLLGLRAAH